MVEIGVMIFSAVIVGFAAAWLIGEGAFRMLRQQLGGLQKEKAVLHDQVRLLERENQAARKHVAEWQHQGSLLTEVKKVTEPILEQAKLQVEILERELQQYQRRNEALTEETDTMRQTAEQLRRELAEERASERELREAVELKREEEKIKPEKVSSRFTPSSGQVRDDLTMISGVGPVIQKKLNAIGVYTFQQISEFTPEDIDRVTEAIHHFKGRIGRDNWIGQAAALRYR
jgi:predicted flap endonuclease-1-like 5' DNA nuclease